MSSFIWVFLKFLILKIYFHNSAKQKQYENTALKALMLSSIFALTSGVSASSLSQAQIHFDPIMKPGESDTLRKPTVHGFTVTGTYARLGGYGQAQASVYQMPLDENMDDAIFSDKPKEWIALSQFPPMKIGTDSTADDLNSQAVYIERMKKAMMFGASAILILVMNPKIVKELDLAQLFSQPVVLIQTATNVTAIMEALINHFSWKVKIAAKKTEQPQTVTVWSTCWRAKPGSGVVCRFDSHLSKEDPGHFWNYFFSLLATFILLLILKSKVGEEEDPDNMDQGQVLRRMAIEALAVMTIKRFKPAQLKQQSGLPSSKEICAICLDNFYPRQKLRVLPCSHEFHKACVDPWLLRQPTCPLCKLDIIDRQLKQGLH